MPFELWRSTSSPSGPQPGLRRRIARLRPAPAVVSPESGETYARLDELLERLTAG